MSDEVGFVTAEQKEIFLQVVGDRDKARKKAEAEAEAALIAEMREATAEARERRDRARAGRGEGLPSDPFSRAVAIARENCHAQRPPVSQER